MSVPSRNVKLHNVHSTQETTFTWLDEFCVQPTASSWLVWNYLELDTLAAFFGDSEAGKTFLSIDIACHVALGLPWCDNKSTKEPSSTSQVKAGTDFESALKHGLNLAISQSAITSPFVLPPPRFVILATSLA